MASSILIQGGYVLHFDSTSSPENPQISFKVQDILVQGTKIVKIGTSLPIPPGSTVIDAHDHIVSPGFIDTHRHLWQTACRGIVHPVAAAEQTLLEYMCSVRSVNQPLLTAEDMFWGQLAGACEAVSSGITAMLDHSHGSTTAAHIDRMLDATQKSGLRSVYAYSKVESDAWNEWQTTHMHEVGRRLRASKDQRVTLGFGYDGLTWESAEEVKDTLEVARKAGSSLTTVHIVPTHFGRPLTDIHAATHAFSSDFVLSHCNHASPADFALIKSLGVGIACTPETELAMGHGQCAIFDCAARGVKAGLGVDTHIICSGDMFGQMRLALQSARSIRNASLYFGTSKGQTSTQPAGQIPRSLLHTSAHMIRFATLGGAETLNMADKIGSLEIGKLADIALISLSSPNMLGVTSDDGSLTTAMVVLANASDVKTVLINGEIVKRDGELTKVNWGDVVKQFRAQQKALDVKMKKAGKEVDWDKQFESLQVAWGLNSTRIA